MCYCMYCIRCTQQETERKNGIAQHNYEFECRCFRLHQQEIYQTHKNWSVFAQFAEVGGSATCSAMGIWAFPHLAQRGKLRRMCALIRSQLRERWILYKSGKELRRSEHKKTAIFRNDSFTYNVLSKYLQLCDTTSLSKLRKKAKGTSPNYSICIAGFRETIPPPCLHNWKSYLLTNLYP